MSGRADPSLRTPLPPVPAGGARPRWSVMIPTYNCAGYLREALASVLAQDPGPAHMQVEVVDDRSTADDPGAVVAELGRGRVGFHQQPRNVGHTANFRTCLERSRGHLVHLLHGDDWVRDGFYDRLGAGFAARPDVGAAFCRHVIVNADEGWELLSDLERDESGVLEGWLERIAERQRIQTPSIVVRRAVYEALGTFDGRLSWVEDWEMWARIAAHYPVWYEVEPVARYRLHGTSSTSRQIRSGENLRDVRRAVAVIHGYLPPAVADAVARRSLDGWATDTLMYRVPKFLDRGDLRTALVQTREALRCSRAPHVLRLLRPIVRRLARAAARRAARRVRRRGRLTQRAAATAAAPRAPRARAPPARGSRRPPASSPARARASG